MGPTLDEPFRMNLTASFCMARIAVDSNKDLLSRPLSPGLSGIRPPDLFNRLRDSQRRRYQRPQAHNNEGVHRTGADIAMGDTDHRRQRHLIARRDASNAVREKESQIVCICPVVAICMPMHAPQETRVNCGTHCLSAGCLTPLESTSFLAPPHFAGRHSDGKYFAAFFNIIVNYL
jgi:hypothetical protein